ncbi:D-glycero-beta-D-manno-heptose 1-phosphate adenylyltransferase [Actinokineospora iranica]|uniref:D-glycero-beta-D-manno-heptose 1-phosphate adenylyltransferase n=1 Tax=Actinokineospora iranica TaxID=1271860 RepID=A0A1G6WNP8_9PSEU|nr:D-glycero-beta-D-manno-heptose 1-phosphate adenylyltransferase [Actinokineospora iranica]SDD67431.1 rfaE bifunctional protein, domain I/rfaE bifunctional protein, domain II [Actinokineospora iranica]
MTLVVVGDCLRDVDLIGASDRLCPDAPVPVVDIEREVSRAGGAGLAATFAAADGAPVVLVTALADDADGELLRADLRHLSVLSAPIRSTPVKTRLRSAGQSLVRMDRGGDGPPPRATDDMLDAVRSAEAVLVADYGRGLAADDRLRAELTALARRRVPVVWDPHPRGPEPVLGIRIATPNLAEARGLTGHADPAAAAGELRSRWAAETIAVTLGSQGALLHNGSRSMELPAPRVRTVDTCGAGDRFAAAVTVRLMAGDPTARAVARGVEEASRFIADDRVPVRSTDALDLTERVRAAGGTVVATGGCFDLMHAGHARTLAAARQLGDCLIVCLNSDASVRRLKGPDRPIVDQSDRAEMLRALDCVDAVAIFDEDGPQRILSELRPDVWVKGGDYAEDDLPETALVRGWGGRVVITPYHDGRSTTRLATALAAAG